MEGYKLNPNTEHVNKIINGIQKNDGNCPCRIQKIPSNLCPCNEFIESKICKCKLFIPIE
jgi:ferredoxin-thioredoxin reductase catalytic subunit